MREAIWHTAEQVLTSSKAKQSKEKILKVTEN
jgi:hypothetical protein